MAIVGDKHQFVHDVRAPFDLKALETARLPLQLDFASFNNFPELRVNHYLVKSNDEGEFHPGEVGQTAVGAFIYYTWNCALPMCLSPSNRYCYVTIDQGWVEPGATLREAGWHIDGLQGDEVPVKVPINYHFIWSDCLPTEFVHQQFDVNGLDLSKHNAFEWLGRQVDPANIVPTRPGFIYASNTYCVHRATPASERVYRRFIRVSYTHTPITSTRMTINPSIKYNYPHHTSTGAIPSHLV